jgi:hypothetical protein
MTLGERINRLDALCEQFLGGAPYRVEYRGQADTWLLDRNGEIVARFEYESDAQALADAFASLLNTACNREVARQRFAKRARS